MNQKWKYYCSHVTIQGSCMTCHKSAKNEEPTVLRRKWCCSIPGGQSRQCPPNHLHKGCCLASCWDGHLGPAESCTMLGVPTLHTYMVAYPSVQVTYHLPCAVSGAKNGPGGLWWMALTVHWISYSLQVLDQIGHQHCRHKNICSSPKHSRHGYCSRCPQGLLRLLLAISTDCKSTGAPVFARRWNLCFYLVTQSSSCRRASTEANSVW